MKNRIAFVALLLALALAPWGAAAASTALGAGGGTSSAAASCDQTANAVAPWYCSQINQATSNIWTIWEPVALIAVLLAFFIAAMIFIASIVLNNEKIRRFAIGELYEACATAIMVIAFMSISATLFGIIPALVTGPVDPYSMSLNYISGTLQASQKPVIALYDAIMVDSYYGSQEIVITTNPAAGLVAKGASMISSIISSLIVPIMQLFIVPADAMLGLLVEGMLALTAEFYMILFFMYVAIPVFLIPGIIFRTILPLRSVGGMLIAMAIAFYLVMPMLFSVAYYFVNISVMSNLNAAAGQITVDSQGTLSQTNAASSTSPLAVDVNGLQSEMGSYFLSVLFYPALILGLTYFAMTTIADFIGGISKTTGRLGLL